MLNKHSVVSVLVAVSISTTAALPAQADDKGASVSQILVKAKPETVYNAIIKMRDESKDTVKELSRDGQHSCILEETFDGLPIIGEAKCVYKEVYVPHQKIEYSMVKSDKFRAFEGRWTLYPTPDGQATNVSLSSYVDLAIPVPFAKQLTKMQTMRGVKRRLKTVKTTCEGKPTISMTGDEVR